MLNTVSQASLTRYPQYSPWMASKRQRDEGSTALGRRILEARQDAKLTQEALGRACGVTKGAVSQWENGDVRNLKIAHLFRLADRTGFEARYLGIGDGPRKRKDALRGSREDREMVEAARRALSVLTPAQRDLFIQSDEVRRLVIGDAYPAERMGRDWTAPAPANKQ